MDFATRIRTLRKEAGLSQEAVARRADVSLNVINRIERGVVTDPHYSTLKRISKALGISVSQLVEEE